MSHVPSQSLVGLMLSSDFQILANAHPGGQQCWVDHADSCHLGGVLHCQLLAFALPSPVPGVTGRLSSQRADGGSCCPFLRP